jgi:EmrB/QacA subfamily drug resistance transporter
MSQSPQSPPDDRSRWLTLAVVCIAQLMIVLDTTIVNVALPSIQRDLHFTQGGLTWVVNAFLIAFGSFLLLAGRLSDLLGRKRLFTAGVIIFTTASVLCGLAPGPGFLVAARFVQGIGAAMQASVILAIIVTEFPGPDERAQAMSAYVFTAVAGGSLGLLAGGVLTQTLSWHWIFFVNLPIGLITVLLGRIFIPRDTGAGLGEGVDWLGSALVTLSLMTAVYAIVQTSTHSWGSEDVLGFATLAALLMAAFLTVESRIANPIMPMRILRIRSLIGGSAVRGLLVTAMYSTFFLGTLYLEHVRHLSAVQTGLAYLPWTLTVAVLSVGVTARLVARFGPMRVLVPGMTAVVFGLLVLATAGPHTSYFPTVLVAFLALGLGLGTAFVPLMTIAMADVPAADAGLGSGITNLSQQVGGALGLAALGSVAASHTRALAAQHVGVANALVGGYHLAYALGASAVVLGIALALVVLRSPQPAGEAVVEAVVEAEPAPVLAEARRSAPRASQIRRRIILPVRVDRRPSHRDESVAGRRQVR